MPPAIQDLGLITGKSEAMQTAEAAESARDAAGTKLAQDPGAEHEACSNDGTVGKRTAAKAIPVAVPSPADDSSHARLNSPPPKYIVPPIPSDPMSVDFN